MSAWFLDSELSTCFSVSLPERDVVMLSAGPHVNGFTLNCFQENCFVPYLISV